MTAEASTSAQSQSPTTPSTTTSDSKAVKYVQVTTPNASTTSILPYQQAKIEQRYKHPIFNQKHDILKLLGEGNSAKAYLMRDRTSSNYSVIKIIKENFLRSDPEAVLSIHNEITILKSMQHKNIIEMIGYGDMG